jgi:hypothetical protein
MYCATTVALKIKICAHYYVRRFLMSLVECRKFQVIHLYFPVRGHSFLYAVWPWLRFDTTHLTNIILWYLKLPTITLSFLLLKFAVILFWIISNGGQRWQENVLKQWFLWPKCSRPEKSFCISSFVLAANVHEEVYVRKLLIS